MEKAELRTICTRKDKSVKVKRKSNVICFCEEEKKGEESQQKRREEKRLAWRKKVKRMSIENRCEAYFN